MTREISFSSFTRELNVHLDTVSFNELIPPVEYDEEGNRTGTYTPDPDIIGLSYDLWGVFCSLTSNLALAIASYADDRSGEEIDNVVQFPHRS